MISKYQGETLEYEVEVKNPDGTPADLTGATATAGVTPQNGDTVRYTPLINTNIVAVTIPDTITAEMLGLYGIEVKVKDAARGVEVVSKNYFLILESKIPTFTA